MGRTIDAIISVFPNVVNDPMFKITSPKDPDYNCISWSLNKKEVWTWPSTKKGEEDFYGKVYCYMKRKK